jgi:hypothetical protein
MVKGDDMKGYKGFDKDLTCKGFQFKEGESFEHEGKVSLCNSGFHFCENPLDCFHYYKPGDSVFHEIEAEGVTDETETDSKRVAKKISIGAAVSIGDIAKAAVTFIFSKADVSETGSATSGIPLSACTIPDAKDVWPNPGSRAGTPPFSCPAGRPASLWK